MSAETRQPSLPLRRSALRSGVATGASILTGSAAAAVAGAYLAHKFGRDARTDGFLAAYGVYLVIVLAAQAFRLVIVPDLTRASADERLPAEFVSYASVLLTLAVPATVLTGIFAGPFGDLLTGTLPPEAADIASSAVVWLVPAAFAQMLAALGASALAARDSYIVAATASSLSLISSAPLTRRGLDAESASAHVLHAAWLSLTLIGAAAGVFTLVGGRVVSFVLGDAFAGDIGSDLGHLVVYLSPWVAAAVAFSVTFPLLFVLEKTRILVPLAALALAVDVPLSLGLRELLGLRGLVLALALATLVVVLALMGAVSLRMLVLTAVGLVRTALFVAALTIASFGIPELVTGGVAAAIAGVLLYVLGFASLRPRGLVDAWRYVRVLHQDRK